MNKLIESKLNLNGNFEMNDTGVILLHDESYLLWYISKLLW